MYIETFRMSVQNDICPLHYPNPTLNCAADLHRRWGGDRMKHVENVDRWRRWDPSGTYVQCAADLGTEFRLRMRPNRRWTLFSPPPTSAILLHNNGSHVLSAPRRIILPLIGIPFQSHSEDCPVYSSLVRLPSCLSYRSGSQEQWSYYVNVGSITAKCHRCCYFRLGLWTAATNGPHLPWVWITMVAWYWQGKTEELRQNPALS
jgi:hypothetical protein